ncbi:hypothetical protein DVT68_09165 [Dyella solisilvae]|uniref:Uncharacterized protein n=1 Tax=Dyella solisilvae TaxID=1920168 RepID=A0A370K7Q3_9GAMM|nr:hypothetical protein [Dyella solisilvae]RDI98678.1 hypothetical protein DVT68_09165 [Dyella solisilvae]
MTKVSRFRQLVFALITTLLTVGGVRADDRTAASACQEGVELFLSNPSKQTLSTLDGGDDSGCWAFVSSTSETLDQLLLHVESGDFWSARFLAEHLSQLDGGELEDSLVALGQFGDHHATELLRYAKNRVISDRQMVDALVMLPLSLSDDFDAQLRWMRNRRSRVASVYDNDLAIERALALRSIDSHISEIEAARR